LNIQELGWNDHFDRNFQQYRTAGLIPARVIEEHRDRYSILDERGESRAEVSGRFQFTAFGRADYPAVGDWVAASDASFDGARIIHAVLPRLTTFSRKAVLAGGTASSGGRTDEQLLATNIDTVFLVSGLDNDFNIRRIERYLAVAWESGSRPVVLLNKADICDDVARYIAVVASSAPSVPILPVSAATGDGIEQLRQFLSVGQTVALLGSSGVGKSTIINRLLGEERQDTGGVRLDDSKGRHTTTRRELIVLPDGGMVIDTPGMRVLKLWGDESGLSRSFQDIEILMTSCRFADCGHNSEPGCAVREAIEAGKLDAGRLQNYLKLQKEQEKLELRKNVRDSRRTNRERDKYYRRVWKEKKMLRKKGLI
jgi:ribosome biogenesis GTPase